MSLVNRRSLKHEAFTSIKARTKYDVPTRAKFWRKEFEKYLDWKMRKRFGDEISQVYEAEDPGKIIIEYKRQDVKTGKHDTSGPLDALVAIQKCQQRKFFLKVYSTPLYYEKE